MYLFVTQFIKKLTLFTGFRGKRGLKPILILHLFHVPVQGFFYFLIMKNGGDSSLQSYKGSFTFDDIIKGLVFHTIHGHFNFVLRG